MKGGKNMKINKKFRNKLFGLPIAILLLMSVLGMGIVSAQEDEVDPGITPDSPLYGIDRALERIRYRLTFNNESKARYGLKMAEERLAEIEYLEEKGMEELADETEQQLDKNMERVKGISDKLPNNAKQGINEAVEKIESRRKPIKNGKVRIQPIDVE